jgi:hypothetical protein
MNSRDRNAPSVVEQNGQENVNVDVILLSVRVGSDVYAQRVAGQRPTLEPLA